MNIISVRFRTYGQTSLYTAPEPLCEGDRVMVETEQGLALAEVAHCHESPPASCDVEQLPAVLRKATEAEQETGRANDELAAQAQRFCRNCIENRRLDMKLVDVEIFFDRSKFIFYFTAPARIDFRELVKDLAQRFRTRIEMRQIGVRDETKLIGGFGVCGCPLCCTTFLKNFETVSIKMAKVQGLTLNPSKLSGICDRLKCCMTYEYECYKQAAKYMPKVGQMVKDVGGGGPYRVKDVNYLDGTVIVEEGNDTPVRKKLFYRDLEKVEN